MSATLDGAPLRLSPLEFRLLDCLAHQPGRAVSAGELAEHLYGAADSGDTNAIEATVWGGRQGHMPTWENRLSALDRKILALYLVDIRSPTP